MNLFATVGIDLPTADRSSGRRARVATKTLHVPLFNYKVVQEAAGRARLFELTDAKREIAVDYARKIGDPKFLKQKEMAVRDLLVQEIVQTFLGYKPYDPAKPYSLARERSIRSGAVDVALGRFNPATGSDEIIAPFELKGPDSIDLDRIMPGRGRSPVQQAWDYAIDAPGSRWVLVSNCLEIRLYGFGRGRDAYERFDLTQLGDRTEQDRLWLILAQSNLFGGSTDQLLRDTDNAYRDVTNELYKQYKGLRERLVNFLTNGGDGPALSPLKAIEIAQKLLDRVLFIAFAQRTDLMADRLLEKAAKERNTFAPQPLWRNFLGLFSAVDRGNIDLGVPEYNGGLFAHDPIADTIIVPDHLAEEIALLGQWDYRREVPVTVLGHLFEQSITDIEALKAGVPPPVSKKKREGVVYTPAAITRFLVEHTVGLTLDERREALWGQYGMDANPSPDEQIAFWRAYLDTLRDFTVLDPACGSGAFLVATFDEMARRYRDVATALEGLEAEIDFDIFDEIVTRNLYGVDLNTESVEITRLSLWLKTARRKHKLQNLEATIKDGNSLIDDPAYTPHPFDWPARFPQIFARGGFDVVIGNPPYVRMEHLKEVKPYLTKHYAVADERTDLYAYFFEKGVHLLKEGGRLGFISSSTFFKTGSGENLRVLLADGVGIEAVVDFGDLQVFEGVTTYPAILTLRKGDAEGAGELSFLNLKDAVPEDLGHAFLRNGQAMPRARLGRGSWQFENDALAALRAKIADGRKTLGEVYGAPLYGIKTGLNEAFVIDRATRDALVKADPKSDELLKPFLRGENIKRWRVESEDLFLINTPKGKVDIEAYPAVRNWLLPFKEKLEQRATKQEWWELQQAQLAYQSRMLEPNLIWPDIAPEARVAWCEEFSLLDCTVFFLPTSDSWLEAFLNSKVAWFFWRTLTPEIRGGFVRLKAQFVEQTPIPIVAPNVKSTIDLMAKDVRLAMGSRLAIIRAVGHRILDLAASEKRKLNRKLEAWHELDFVTFRSEIKKAFGTDIPLKERAEWEAYFSANAAEVCRLGESISAVEQELDSLFYKLFGLDSDDIVLLEQSLTGAI